MSHRPVCTVSPWLLRVAAAALLAFAVTLISPAAFGQVASGSLSGTVFDASGAVVPGAHVVLKNEATNAIRETVSNGTGYFNFPAIQPASYTVTVTATGFKAWEQRSITFNQGENRTLPDISLQLGVTSQEVTVVAPATAAAPIDTGESRQTLNSRMISQLSIQGRDAAELIRLMPGVGMNNGLSQGSWNSLTTGTNSGPIGQFTANGTQPYGGMTMTMDGASIVDPGNQGTQIANINQDQTAEVTILNSAFGAEYAKGPVTFQAISKSGTSVFHGGAYMYARNGSVNAEDSFLKNQGVPKPIDRYWYPGAEIGGPILIPGTNFNKDHSKAYFFAAFEYMNQHPEGTLREAVVPNAQMLQGNFGPDVVSQFYGNANVVPCGSSGYPSHDDPCASGQIVNGQIPRTMFDPNSLILTKLLPPANVDPASHSGNNFAYLDNPPQNRWEFRVRGDYNFSDNTKVYVSYNRQNEKDINNYGVWWWPGDTVPYPSQLPAQTIANDWSANLLHVFSPTLTNELVFTYAYYINPVKLVDPSAVDPSSLGFTAKGVFSPGITPAIPNLLSWGCNSSSNAGCFPGIYGPGFAAGFANGAFGKAARVPSIADNLTKVLGTHTLKFGLYWDSNGNQQTSGYGSWPQGAYEFDQWGSNSTGNPIADFLIGHAQSYAQVSADPVYNMKYHEISFYGQDQWKLSRRLTVTYGLRMDHEGQWYPTNTPGLAVWNPATYSNAPGVTGFPGLQWNAFGDVPLSGFTSRFLPDPRIGVAYDLFGNGKTVLRGGFGVYRYQFAYNDVAVATDPPLGITSFTSSSALDSLSQASQFTPSPASGVNGNINALAMNDNRTPYTESWDFIVSQRMPWKSLLEVEYVGNRSRNLLIAGNGTGAAYLANINKIPVGALFGPDPATGVTYFCTGTPGPNCVTGAPDSSLLQDYRPYANYQTLDIDTHGSYSNYNGFVVLWQKQTGPVTFITNYTFSKTMGIRDGQTNNGNGNGAVIDTFSIANNYGALAYDHTHIFNAGYVFRIPGLGHANALAKAIVNGWQLSGTTHFESGPPLQPNTAGNLNVVWPSGVSDAINPGGVGNQQILGTDSVNLVPALTCDPRSGLKSGQFFNTNCFAIPARGSNGPVIWPYIKGPGNFNTDLAVFKDFKIKERHTIEFRMSAFNVLNHPLQQFGLGNDVNLQFACPSGNCTSLSQYVNTNPHTTGVPMYTVGRRVVEFALKYSF